MGKQRASVPPEQLRKSERLRLALKPSAPLQVKKAVVKKAAPKTKKVKAAENGSAKAEEPKAAAAETN